MKGPDRSVEPGAPDATVGPLPYPRTGNHDQNDKAVAKGQARHPSEKSRPGQLWVGMGWLWRGGQAAVGASPVTWFQVVNRVVISCRYWIAVSR